MQAYSALSKGHKVASPGAAVAVVCFFLPWILVSCGGQSVGSFSGWELAAGTTVRAGFSQQNVPGSPLLFLVLLAGLAALAVVYYAWKRGNATPTDSYALIGLGALPLVILFLQFSQSQSQAAQLGMKVDFQIGLWGVILGYIAVIVGGAIDLQRKT